MTALSDLEADVRRATEREFTVPETPDGRPCLLVGPDADRPAMVAPRLCASASECFRHDYPTTFDPGDRVTVEATERGGLAYVWVVRSGNQREMWWRQ